jgi:hypothetical protein
MPVYGGISGGVSAGVGASDIVKRYTYEAAAGADRVENTIVNTTHATKHTFNVGDLRVGDRVEVHAFFNIVSANSTNSLIIASYLDGNILNGANFTDPLNSGQVFTWYSHLYVTAIGASGSVHCDGGQRRAGYTSTGYPVVDFAVDMSSAVDLTFKTGWNAVDPANIVDCRALYVTIHRP